jgi:hypothetical protein
VLTTDGFCDVIDGVDDLDVEVESLEDFVIKKYKLIEKHFTPFLVSQNSEELVVTLVLRAVVLGIFCIIECYESGLRQTFHKQWFSQDILIVLVSHSYTGCCQ